MAASCSFYPKLWTATECTVSYANPMVRMGQSGTYGEIGKDPNLIGWDAPHEESRKSRLLSAGRDVRMSHMKQSRVHKHLQEQSQ